MKIPRIAITAGEPAGIGPDILLMVAQKSWPAELVAIADEDMLRRRASMLGLPITLKRFNPTENPTPNQPSNLTVYSSKLPTQEILGIPDKRNAAYVLDTIKLAVDGCKIGNFAAMVTCPVQKSIICATGFQFSGHTEFISKLTGTKDSLMLLLSNKLKVALATNHIPLSDIPDSITEEILGEKIKILDNGLRSIFQIVNPTIGVLALNPHAGEEGYLGLEEINTIEPAISKMRKNGIQLEGPLPADTAFTHEHIKKYDAYLAMYHDQGLPVIKYAGFGSTANLTLGLPLFRISVDHGTALNVAGSGLAKDDSLRFALQFAINNVTC